MKQNHRKPPARKVRQTPQTRSDRGVRFKAECATLGLSVDEIGKLLRVTSRTVHNWQSGRVRAPYAAVKVLRLMKRMDLPGAGWDGWTFHSGRLWTPEGRSIAATDGSWWSLLVRQARGFQTVYAELCRVRLDLAQALAAQGPALAGAASQAGAGAVGLVSFKTSRPIIKPANRSSSPEPFVCYEIQSDALEVQP